MIHQENDDYQTKDEKLMTYKKIVDDFKKYFAKIIFEQIPRESNQVANVMATIASLIDMPQNTTHCEFLVDNLLVPTYEIPPFELICVIGLDSPWYDEILTYLCDNTLPPTLSNNQCHTFIW